jgi:hypothetical protein
VTTPDYKSGCSEPTELNSSDKFFNHLSAFPGVDLALAFASVFFSWMLFWPNNGPIRSPAGKSFMIGIVFF